MAETHDIGRAFAHGIRLVPTAPRFHFAPTHEIDWPYRYSRSVVVRYWGERGFVLGWWRHTGRSEKQALLAALGGREGVAAFDDAGYLLPQFDSQDA